MEDALAAVAAIPGLRFAAGSLGIKREGAADAALFALPAPARYAGVFTTNRFRSACVESASERLRAGSRIQAVLVTSGNANAGTGPQGRADTEMLAAEAGRLLGCGADQVIALHTGVIGVPLRARRLLPALAGLTAGLSAQAEAAERAARAMMTTDTFPKLAARRVTIGGRTGAVAGAAKGAGMIHPRLATMLAVVFTDFALPDAALQAALADAVRTSFNAISVDGDTSPNDSVVLLATGAAGLLETGAERGAFGAALREVCGELAKMIVRDGEGASKFIEISVAGAASEADADRAAGAIATSPLVKTAFYGEDFNPGRILSAIGRSGAAADFERLTLAIGELPVYGGGQFLPVAAGAARAAMAAAEIRVAVDLAAGTAAVRFFTCDLTPEYVRINGEYTT